MKIIFITDLYPINTDEATTPVTLHNFVKEWKNLGNIVDVIKPNFIFNSFLRGKPYYKNGFYEYDGVKIFNVNYVMPFLFNCLKKLPKSFKFENYDVIICHMPSGLILGNKIALKYGKPLICAVHKSDIEVLTNPLYSIYFKSELKKAYKNAVKIACRSKVLQNQFKKIMPECSEKTFTAFSGVNVDKNITVRNFKDKKIFSVVTCANLIKRKNIDKVIKALDGLEKFNLRIIGDGKELQNLKKLVKTLSLENKVKFLGRLKNEKVLSEMRKSDIFILPSVNETFGMVYLEALASGCITVCTKNDGIDGIIKDGENGFLCNPYSQSIKQVLLRIEELKNLNEISKNAINTAQSLSPEACAKNYSDNFH